jgi:hypothetical protein
LFYRREQYLFVRLSYRDPTLRLLPYSMIKLFDSHIHPFPPRRQLPAKHLSRVCPEATDRPALERTMSAQKNVSPGTRAILNK